MFGKLLGVEESGGELFAGAGVMDVPPLEPGVVEDDPPPDVDGVIDVPPLEPGVLEDTETQRQGPEEEQVSVEEDFVLKYRTAAS